MYDFKLPDIGEGMHEGEIVRWLVSVGDDVETDQPIVEVQTDKVTAELPAPVTGHILQIACKPGEIVPVGATLVTIGTRTEVAATSAEVVEAEAPLGAQFESRELKPKPIPAQPESDFVVGDGTEASNWKHRLQRVLATPHIRQMARVMKINIEEVLGTGKGGRVTEADLHGFVRVEQEAKTLNSMQQVSSVENAVRPKGGHEKQSNKTLEVREERILLRGVRKKIAEHMATSVRHIPHVTQVDEMEMDGVKALRERLKGSAQAGGVKLTYLAFFIKAVTIALKEFPMFNASLDEGTGEIVLKHYYNIGIATDTERGLVVPVIHDADQLTIFDLAKEIGTLAQAAREGNLSLPQISGGTFTITNVGPIGGLYATPIINYPEAAILGLHKIEPRMVVRNNEGVIRHMMNMSLSFDHRLIDGATSVRFTNRIRHLLENPENLFLQMV